MFSLSIRGWWILSTLILLQAGFSIAIGILGILQINDHNQAIIPFIISAFLVVLSLAIATALAIFNSTKYAVLGLPILCFVFQLVSGVVWAVKEVNREHNRNLATATIIIFVLNEVASSISLTSLFFSLDERRQIDAKLEQQAKDLEAQHLGEKSSFATLNDSELGSHKLNLTSGREYGNVQNYDDEERNSFGSGCVSKKVSEMTLVNQVPPSQYVSQLHIHTASQDSGYADTVRFKHISEESNQLAAYSEIIDASIMAQKGLSKGAVSGSVNWMDSSTKLYTLALPEQNQSQFIQPQGPQEARRNMSMNRKASFSKFILPSSSVTSLRRSSYSLSHSKSVPTFFKQHKKSQSVNNLNSKTTRFVEVESEFKNDQTGIHSLVPPMEQEVELANSPEKLIPRRVSLIESTSGCNISELANSPKPHALTEPSTKPTKSLRKGLSDYTLQPDLKKNSDTHVKRSKSTSYIGGRPNKIRKREDRWNSINDEKLFLQNVNESLLPSVLKSGESPIMESKRKQESSLSASPQGEEHLDAPFVQPEVDLRPKELISSGVKNSDTTYEIVDEDEDDEENLPYISEFGEYLDQPEFDGFTQNTLIVPQDREMYRFGSENEVDDLQIPKSTSHQSPIWMGKDASSGAKKGDKKSYISLQNWSSNSEAWTESRQRIGSSNMNGIKLSMGEAEHKQSESTKAARPPFSLSNRSFSAPSLHTFRDISSGSHSTHTSSNNKVETASTGLTLSSDSNQQQPHPHLSLQIFKTPVNDNYPVNTASSSPIKKFFQESPRRLSNVFKRQSISNRHSLEVDGAGFGHKHNGSVTSNAFSISSTKSVSPKRSIKSFLNKNTTSFHKKNSSLPSFNFALKDQSKLQIQPSKWHSQPKFYSYEFHNVSRVDPRQVEAIDRWDFDIETTQTSDQSRVSSVPSAVIGEYDKEKWGTLKALANQESIALNVRDN